MFTPETTDVLAGLLTKEDIAKVVESMPVDVLLERLNGASVKATDPQAAELIAKVATAKSELEAAKPVATDEEVAETPAEESTETSEEVAAEPTPEVAPAEGN